SPAAVSPSGSRPVPQTGHSNPRGGCSRSIIGLRDTNREVAGTGHEASPILQGIPDLLRRISHFVVGDEDPEVFAGRSAKSRRLSEGEGGGWGTVVVGSQGGGSRPAPAPVSGRPEGTREWGVSFDPFVI